MPDNIGARPTRESVKLSTDTGNGTIPAASPRAAGVMTAKMAADLERVVQWIEAAEDGVQPIVVQQAAPRPQPVVIPPAAPAPQQKISLPPEIANTAQQLRELHERVSRLEQQMNERPQGQPGTSVVDPTELQALAETLAQVAERVFNLGNQYKGHDKEIAEMKLSMISFLDIAKRLNGTAEAA